MQLPERSSSISSPKSVSTSPTKIRRPVSPPTQSSSTATSLKPKASIRDFSDFKQFGFSTTIDEALLPSIDAPAPGPATATSPPSSPGKQRKPLPDQPSRKPPPPPLNELGASAQLSRPPTTRFMTPPDGALRQRPPPPPAEPRVSDEFDSYDRAKKIFKPLEDYLNDNYGRYESLNMSFSTARPKSTGRTVSEGSVRAISDPVNALVQSPFDYGAQIDAKTLLLGDVAENGDWWTGRLERNYSERRDSHGNKLVRRKGTVSSKSPMIDWEKMGNWYSAVHHAGQSWWDKLSDMDPAEHPGLDENTKGAKNTHEIEMEIATAREHAERALLKVTENILKRPGRLLQDPEDMRFLILILMNPSLYPSSAKTKARVDSARPRIDRAPSAGLRFSSNTSTRDVSLPPDSPSKIPSKEYGQHNGILKRVFGLIANSPDSCHRYVMNWFARMPEARFRDLVDLVASFITYRLSKRRVRPRSASTPMDNGLIPDLSGSAMHTSAQLQSASGLGGSIKKRDDDGVQSVADYSEDWQLRAAAKVMALLFAANNMWHSTDASQLPQPTRLTRPRTIAHGQLMPTSDFYNTLLDYTDLIADFKVWESRKAKFTFCQYPFLLSIGSKTRILEHDARRQMENKAREAYFDNVTSGRSADIYLNLHVRRECVVDDSLRQISEAVGTGQEELKKGLRVKFTGEEGIDAGGLRKEWFLMLVRDIFDPNHGKFSGTVYMVILPNLLSRHVSLRRRFADLLLQPEFFRDLGPILPCWYSPGSCNLQLHDSRHSTAAFRVPQTPGLRSFFRIESVIADCRRKRHHDVHSRRPRRVQPVPCGRSTPAARIRRRRRSDLLQGLCCAHRALRYRDQHPTLSRRREQSSDQRQPRRIRRPLYPLPPRHFRSTPIRAIQARLLHRLRRQRTVPIPRRRDRTTHPRLRRSTRCRLAESSSGLRQLARRLRQAPAATGGIGARHRMVLGRVQIRFDVRAEEDPGLHHRLRPYPRRRRRQLGLENHGRR